MKIFCFLLLLVNTAALGWAQGPTSLDGRRVVVRCYEVRPQLWLEARFVTATARRFASASP